ncbi:MAG TPA: hypothetical protein VHE61_20515 [Opitutaceae bacterium]|nr:hypothetical protein [Opitutaceae bacterium]
MFLAVIQQAANAATGPNGPFYGYPPWLVVLVGAFVAALVLWIFSKLLKWALWILILVVIVGGIVTAAKMYLGK